MHLAFELAHLPVQFRHGFVEFSKLRRARAGGLQLRAHDTHLLLHASAHFAGFTFPGTAAAGQEAGRRDQKEAGDSFHGWRIHLW